MAVVFAGTRQPAEVGVNLEDKAWSLFYMCPCAHQEKRCENDDMYDIPGAFSKWRAAMI